MSNKTLQNSWKKLWPDIPINEVPSEEDDNDGRGGNGEIREMMVEIQSCESRSMEDQEKTDWLNFDQCDRLPTLIRRRDCGRIFTADPQ